MRDITPPSEEREDREDRGDPEAPYGAAGDPPPSADQPEAARGRRRWRRPAFLLPLAAGALVLAVLGGVAVLGGHVESDADDADPVVGADGEATYDFAPRVNADTTGGAAELLAEAARAASRAPEPRGVRDERFVYTRGTKFRYLPGGDRFVPPPPGEGGEPISLNHPPAPEERWISVDGTREGLRRSRGRERTSGGLDYRTLERIPTTPEATLEWLHQHAASYGDPEGVTQEAIDQVCFSLAAELLDGALLPPDASAALYRAIARLSGLQVVPDAVTADGRHGVAVVRKGSSIYREELILDRKTREPLGTRTVIVQEHRGERAGQVTDSVATQERAVVDEAGQRPGES